MTVAEQAKQILDLAELDLPECPRVVGIEVEEFIDHDGDDALWVYLYLDESTKESELNGTDLLDISMRVQKKLFEGNIQKVAYTRIFKKSELAEVLSADDEES